MCFSQKNIACLSLSIRAIFISFVINKKVLMAKKCLITGVSGFIGSYIAKTLDKEGYSIRAIRRPDSSLKALGSLAGRIEWVESDVNDPVGLNEAFDGIQDVVHAAAIVSFAPSKARLMQKVNVEGTANMINIALEKGIRNFCHISSIAAVGNPDDPISETKGPLGESEKWDNNSGHDAYSLSKYRAELEVRRGIQEGLNCIMLNPSFVIGRGELHRSSNQLFDYILNGGRFYSSGTMNCVDVRDVAEITAAVLKEENAHLYNDRYILNADTRPTYEVMKLIAENLHKKPPSVKVNPLLGALAWRAESMKCFFTRQDPRITKAFIKAGQRKLSYSSEKICRALNFKFRNFEESILWACEAHR